MALIKCPECGVEISDKALTCPKCGYPINANQKTNINLSALKEQVELCGKWQDCKKEYFRIKQYLEQTWLNIEEKEDELQKKHIKDCPNSFAMEYFLWTLIILLAFVPCIVWVVLGKNFDLTYISEKNAISLIFVVLFSIVIMILARIFMKKYHKKLCNKYCKKAYKNELNEYIKSKNDYNKNKERYIVKSKELLEIIEKYEKTMKMENYIIPESYWGNAQYIYNLIAQKRARDIHEAIAIFEQEAESEYERFQQETLYSDLEYTINSNLNEIKHLEETRLKEARENQTWNDLNNAAILYGLGEISEK